MNAEKKQIRQEKAEKARKNMKKLLRKRQASLLKTEYGQFINYLKPFAVKSDSLFNQAKQNYMDNVLVNIAATSPVRLADRFQRIQHFIVKL